VACVCVCVCVQLFHNAIDACLKMAAKQGIKSIAFPVLGTFALDYHDDFVATSMAILITKFYQGQPQQCADIRIVRQSDTVNTVSLCLYTSLLVVCLQLLLIVTTCHMS
jgi:O-acetyl-ADP-ribose deacetylase (regulator of RNase III)